MNPILICRDCDTVYRALWKVDWRSSAEAAIFFAIANLTPILRIDIAGIETKANVWFAMRSLRPPMRG